MLLDLDAVFDPDRRVTPIVTADDLPADWHDSWGERAAIMEYDGGLPRTLAERLALLEIIALMKAGQTADDPTPSVSVIGACRRGRPHTRPFSVVVLIH